VRGSIAEGSAEGPSVDSQAELISEASTQKGGSPLRECPHSSPGDGGAEERGAEGERAAAEKNSAEPRSALSGQLSLIQRSEVFLSRCPDDSTAAITAGVLRGPRAVSSGPSTSVQRRVRRRGPGGVPLQEESSQEVVEISVKALPEQLCTICYDRPRRPKVAVLCGHFGCEDCWQKWLNEKHECPVCRCKVRPNNLVLLKGWGEG